MRFTLGCLILEASLTLATERKQPDVQVGHNTIKARTLPGSNLFLRQYESCDIGYTECGPACMLISSECCVSSGGMGSCPIGYYCDGTGAEAGCCERGKICSGLSDECTDRSKRCGDGCIPESETCDESASPTSIGTSSGSSPTSTSSGGTTSGGGSVLGCDVGEEECDTGCMPVGAQCCSNSGLGNYCEAGYVCVGSTRCRRGSGTNFTYSRTISSSIVASTTTPSGITATSMPTSEGTSSPSLSPSGGGSSQGPETSPGSTASGVYVPGALVGVALLGAVLVAMGF